MISSHVCDEPSDVPPPVRRVAVTPVVLQYSRAHQQVARLGQKRITAELPIDLIVDVAIGQDCFALRLDRRSIGFRWPGSTSVVRPVCQ